MEQHLAATARRRRRIRYVAPGALGVVAAVCAAVVASPWGSSGPRSRAAAGSHATLPRVPPYWTVRPGDTYALISEKTGLTVAQLEAFNPDTSELGLIPGQRLNLRAHPPPPRPKPPGPLFWTVRSGQSFGSIAAQAGINLVTLEALNPQLKPATLQPGDRVRLRPGTASSATSTLTAAELETFNLRSGPLRLVPVDLNVWHLPAPRPKPLGPLFWTVRSGQSFGSIAEQTGINLVTLEALNPQLKPPATLQPGDRLRLRK